MKIQPLSKPDESRPSDKAARRPSSAPAPGANQDRVEVSATVRELRRLADGARVLPDVRAERVEELRREIPAGRYGIDPKALARAILELEDGLFG